MPVGVAVVLASSHARAGVPSAKMRFPRAEQHWIDEQYDLVRKAVFE
jgi:hypothetical protein